MFSDPEVEVRTISAARICAVAAANRSKEFLEELIQAVEKLVQAKEQSHHVRASLAGSFLKLAPIVGVEVTVQRLVNIFLSLIKDKSPEVRLKLIGTLGDLSDVVELKELSQSLVPSIKELGNDHQWRVRLAVLDSMPALAKYLGVAKFTEELRSLFMPWLTDPVFSVREAASETFRRLAQELGPQWSEDNIIPQLNTLISHKNYLYRISAMLCAKKLAEVCNEAFIKSHLVPMVIQLCKDPVPNVRFNATKTIQAMHKASPGVKPSTLDCLRKLNREEDPDVIFFAQKAMSDMGEVA
jgi:serine/threonine-protein phosphatase 2A regulatory subunit A